ncbi:MAG: hypothetical protein IPK19_01400 [Chloroflexi bacterium]|nr:hypothetical protein [Chloroflexota bacterium]
MGLIDRLLRFARQVVENVMRDVLGQVNVVDNLIQQTIQSFIREIVGGAWQGTAADEFVTKVNQVVNQQGFPMRDMVMDINTRLTSAIDVIDQADNNAHNVVNSLSDVFKGIF